MNIRPIQTADRDAVRQFIRQYWGGSDQMVSRGKIHFPVEQSGFLAEADGRITGLITFDISAGEMEITLLDSRERNQGVGSRLVEQVLEAARLRGCRRLWLITTNDNIRAIEFYQKRGFDLVKLHRNSMEEARKLKPAIPQTGYGGIPIRHELEFEVNIMD